MDKRLVAAALFGAMAFALACPGNAAEKEAKTGEGGDKRTVQMVRYGVDNYRITYKINTEILKSSGSLTAVDRADAEFSASGETSVDLGEVDGKRKYDMKRYMSKARFKPLADPQDGNHIILESQFELQGPTLVPGAGSQVAFVSFQAATRLLLGKSTLLLDEPKNRIEVTVEAVK